VNCPENRGPSRPAGLAATDFARQWLAAEPVLAVTHSQDSFGRWLATITRADGSSLADALVEAGHGVRVL
jgi:endonuclease YncB( thermonuclease family)